MLLAHPPRCAPPLYPAAWRSMQEIQGDFSASPGAPSCRSARGHAPPAFTPDVMDTAPLPAASRYLHALLTPSNPQNPTARKPTPITARDVCFRCLAPDHLVADCRDPVCCRNCRGSVHLRRHCKMPITRVFTSYPRQRTTVANPTSRAVVHVVPFVPRSSTSPSPPSSAPPPPTPAHLAPAVAAAFDPLNMIPSSSSGEVNFELPHAGFSPISG